MERIAGNLGIIIAFFCGALVAKNWQRIKNVLPFTITIYRGEGNKKGRLESHTAKHP